jgi:hypothetical protein
MSEKRSGLTPAEQAHVEGMLAVIRENLNTYVTTYELVSVNHTPDEAVPLLSDQIGALPSLDRHALVRELAVAVRTIHDLRQQVDAL